MTYYYTSINCAYIPRAMILVNTLKKHNPNAKFCLLLCDMKPENLLETEKYFNTIWTLQDLDLQVENLDIWIFKHTVRELCTAAKGHTALKIFRELHADKVIYLDPDIAVFESLKNIEDILDEYDAALIPHLTKPAHISKALTDEVPLLNAGIYNLGFIALRNSENGIRIAQYWNERLLEYCYDDYSEHNMDRSLYADQKWCSLLPVLFDNICILKDPGYNVARWNYSERNITMDDQDNFRINNEKLFFFHFSYWNTEAHEGFHNNLSDWYTIQGETDLCLRKLAEWYAEQNRIVQKEFDLPKDYRFVYNYFSNGERIPDECRWALRNDNHLWNKFRNTNPFVVMDGENSYFHWYKSNILKKVIPVEEDLSQSKNGNGILNTFRSIYLHLPVSQMLRVKCKNLFFILTKPILKNTQAYNRWNTAHQIKLNVLKPSIQQTNESMNHVQTENLFKGMNITGFIKGEFGTAHSARLFIKAALAASIPVSIINSVIPIPHSCNDITYDNFLQSTFDKKVTLWCYNADMVEVAQNFIPHENWKDHYNIGLWYWEAPDFPDEWVPSFKPFDEIWVASRFTYDAVSKKSPVPVRCIPLSTEIDRSLLTKGRSEFDLPESTFLFITMYDIYSVNERKNPKAVIKTFMQAFDKNDTKVGLVIKINNSDSNPDEVQELRQSISSYPNIYLVLRTLPQYEVYSLINCCDSLVSLHRSEGFGLALTEAMFLGKPVIATNWSGNVDFMTVMNSCPVEYKLIQLDKDYGPYKSHQRWADADISHAATYMRRLVEDPRYYSSISENGRKTIENEYSPYVVGCMIRERLKQLGLL